MAFWWFCSFEVVLDIRNTFFDSHVLSPSLTSEAKLASTEQSPMSGLEGSGVNRFMQVCAVGVVSVDPVDPAMEPIVLGRTRHAVAIVRLKRMPPQIIGDVGDVRTKLKQSTRRVIL